MVRYAIRILQRVADDLNARSFSPCGRRCPGGADEGYEDAIEMVGQILIG